MHEAVGQTSEHFPELVNILSFLSEKFPHNRLLALLSSWQNVLFSIFVAVILAVIAYLASRNPKKIPTGLQNVVEIFVEAIDNFICGILGKDGRKHLPFIGTLFIYILCMNLAGLVPFLKSATSSLSCVFALAICVFVYVQFTALRELGILGYLDHLMEKPRGGLAWSVILPVFMLLLNIISQLIRPMSLTLRLRSNIWADDMLLASVAGFGAKGIPLYLFSTFLVIISALVQAVVFSLLSTIYLALFIVHEE